MTPPSQSQQTSSDDFDDGWCGDYPEHDYELRDEVDGERVYDCRRCGAELLECDEDADAETGNERS